MLFFFFLLVIVFPMRCPPQKEYIVRGSCQVCRWGAWTLQLLTWGWCCVYFKASHSVFLPLIMWFSKPKPKPKQGSELHHPPNMNVFAFLNWKTLSSKNITKYWTRMKSFFHMWKTVLWINIRLCGNTFVLLRMFSEVH